jgi:hypothetical protein
MAEGYNLHVRCREILKSHTGSWNISVTSFGTVTLCFYVGLARKTGIKTFPKMTKICTILQEA